jgi:hypothetical protein
MALRTRAWTGRPSVRRQRGRWWGAVRGSWRTRRPGQAQARQYIDSMFRALIERASRRLPARCAICHAWPSQVVCNACVARFAQPVPRCATCALPVPANVHQCGACLKEPPPLDVCLAAVAYRWPWADCVTQFKFAGQPGWGGRAGHRDAQHPLGRACAGAGGPGAAHAAGPRAPGRARFQPGVAAGAAPGTAAHRRPPAAAHPATRRRKANSNAPSACATCKGCLRWSPCAPMNFGTAAWCWWTT